MRKVLRKRKKHFVILCLASILFLASCGRGPIVEVPPAHVGKRSTPNGLDKKIIQPSKFRLAYIPVGVGVGDSLILAQASDYPTKEEMQVFMPKDQLNLTLEVRGTFAISNDKKNINKIFARIPPKKKEHRVYIITMDRVYKTYAKPIIRETTRSIMTKYSIFEIMSNRDIIGKKLAKTIQAKLKNTPIKTIYFGFANIQPPEVVVKAQEAAKKREIAIKEAENDKLVKLKQAEAAYEVAIKQQQVDLKEAETQVLVNKKLTEGVNQAFVIQRSLKALEKLATNNNTVFFLPMEAMKNPAILTGMVNKGDD